MNTEPFARQKTDWLGAWIWTDAAPAARNAYACFRRTFRVERDAVARIAVTADSFYWLHVDGAFLGRGPSRSHLDYYSFDRYEAPLRAGDHVIAVLVHHIGVVNATLMTGRPALLAEVSGADETFGTDASWRCLRPQAWRSDVPCLMSHFGFWEERDLGLLPPSWTAVGFDDSGWTPATVIGRPPCPPWTRLVERDIALPRRADIPVARIAAGGSWRAGDVREDDEAKRRTVAGGWLDGAATTSIPSKQSVARVRSVQAVPPALPLALGLNGGAGAGHWLTVDFGRTVSGYPVVEMKADRGGTLVDLSYDDVTRADGSVDAERTYGRMTDRFVLAEGPATIQPLHPRGFRYLTLDVAGSGPVSIRAIHAIEETYPFAQPPAFTSSDARLATYARRAAETVRICTTDAFTDCATRERVQWMEDLYMHARVAAYAFGDTAMLRRALFQAAQNVLPDGRINGFMPSERTGCAFSSSSLLWLHLLCDYWLFAGDEPGIRALLPAARRLLDFLASRSDGSGLIESWPAGQFWDWAPIESQGCLLLTNAAYAWALSRLAGHAVFADALGRDLATLAARVREAAHTRFWVRERGLYRDAPETPGRTPIFSQHANALAVLSGVCPEAEREAVLRRAIDPAGLGPVPVGEHQLRDHNRPDPAQVVPVGTLWFGHFLCQALFESNLAAEAIGQMHALWGCFEGAPTFPETRIPSRNTTQCHGWAAGPAFLLPAYVLGVRPTGPGWSEVCVRPRPGPLDHAAGTVPTPRGPIAVRWRRTETGLDLSFDAPRGVRVLADGAGARRTPPAP